MPTIPPPIAPSDEVTRYAVRSHAKACGVEPVVPMPVCECGETRIAVCPRCGEAVMMLVRQDSWCLDAELLWLCDRVPFRRWHP
jgi:hypothetical protein